VGKASKRKNQRRQGTGQSRADFERQRAYDAMLPVLRAMTDMAGAEEERKDRARRVWCGGAEPQQATLPRWREDSVGDRFFSASDITDAIRAPELADAEPPTARQMAENSIHWMMAISALVRRVVLDRVPVNDLTVTRVLDLLAPAVLTELAEAEDEDFAEIDGPLYRLGGSLIEATWAIVGLDPLDQILALIGQRFDDAQARVEDMALPGGKIIAENLIRAFASEYRCEEPGDVRTLERLDRTASGNPLTDLILAKEVAPEDALRVGLIVLATLADLARTDAESVLPRT
jgi:hypothetical protein